MYCVKCKGKTESVNVTEVTSKNNRIMLKGSCVVCGSKKSQFIKNISGRGISDIIGRIGELHLPASKGEEVVNGSFNNLNKYSYCGPGTKYEQRDREGYKGINELDRMCKLHDRFYNENTDTTSRNISDEALAHRASEIANDLRFDDEQRRFAKYVALIMKNKARFGFGMTSKNLKKGP